MDFPQAVRHLAPIAGVTLDSDTPTLSPFVPQEELKANKKENDTPPITRDFDDQSILDTEPTLKANKKDKTPLHEVEEWTSLQPVPVVPHM